MSTEVRPTSQRTARFGLTDAQVMALHYLARRNRVSIEAAIRQYLASHDAHLVRWTYFQFEERYELEVALPDGPAGQRLDDALSGRTLLLENHTA